ncbi:MAG: signal peptide peptidase SppA [Cryomorphaceae bacterium]|nr:signal peptide peptidase SppA [Cryomorphaceae bacterium]
MNFGKTVFATLIGSTLAFLAVGVIFFLIIAAMIGAAVSGVMNGDGQGLVDVKNNSVLHLKLDAPILERGNENDFEIDWNTLQPSNKIGLNHLLQDLEDAATDDRIKGAFLDLSFVMASPATLKVIHDALEDFKASGKWIVAYGESYSMSAYYLASTASEVYLYPEGQTEMHGLMSELMFFKGMLDKIGVDVQVIRGPNNKFKSAVEPFMLEHISESNRLQLTELLGGIWGTYKSDMAASRGISIADIDAMADSLSIRLSEDALAAKLVDGLLYRDQVMDILREKVGAPVVDESEGSEENEEKTKDDINFVDQSQYHKAGKANSESSFGKDRIAVVYAVGGIESGRGDDQTIGSERLAEALADARKDDKVKAIVLRVNSPGGSALASDVIWRETQLIKQAGKPFVVSMGDLAASGGYYIACGADKIYANATTITGSIGVFGIIPNMQSLFEDKMGITFDRVQTNAEGGIITGTHPLTDLEREMLEETVTEIYDDFTNLVAEGRGMTQAQVDSLGQGRIWTGLQAKANGLVDEIGDLDDAIAEAARLANLEDYRTKDFPSLIDPMEELMKGLTGGAEATIMARELGVDIRYIDEIKKVQTLLKGDRMQMRMPFYMHIQ